jgi:glycosyltransferase involved in cell wall biosynthesis
MKALLADDVIVLPQVSNEDLCALYSSAELLLFPSIAEGFGWPIAEAMACGCRVVTTGCAPMTEVGGDAAIYLNPADESPDWIKHAAAKVLQTLEQSAGAREATIRAGFEQAKKFTTDGMIEKYLRLYREALAAR